MEALASANHPVTQQLTTRGLGKVGLIGRSAGSEESEIAPGVYQDVDPLVRSGFTHQAPRSPP